MHELTKPQSEHSPCLHNQVSKFPVNILYTDIGIEYNNSVRISPTLPEFPWKQHQIVFWRTSFFYLSGRNNALPSNKFGWVPSLWHAGEGSLHCRRSRPPWEPWVQQGASCWCLQFLVDITIWNVLQAKYHIFINIFFNKYCDITTVTNPCWSTVYAGLWQHLSLSIVVYLWWNASWEKGGFLEILRLAGEQPTPTMGVNFDFQRTHTASLSYLLFWRWKPVSKRGNALKTMCFQNGVDYTQSTVAPFTNMV